MPNPKETIAEQLALNGRTMPGLRASLAPAAAAYQLQHDETRARAVEAGKTIEDDKPGGAHYNPGTAALRACLSVAFPAASRIGLEPLKVERGEEAEVLRMLAGLSLDAPSGALTDWATAELDDLCAGLAQIGSHSARYANTRIGVAVTDSSPTGVEEEAVLSSRTVKSPLRHDYSGNGSNIPLMRPLFAAFEYAGKRTSLYQELKADNQPFLKATGLPAEVVTRLQEALGRPVELASGVSQIAWPVEGGYHALSPLPSVAVLDELSYQHRYDGLLEHFAGQFLPLQTLSVGGANPMNAGAFNAAALGDYPIYLSRLFTGRHSDAARLADSLWTKSLLGYPAKALIARLSMDHSRREGKFKDTHYSDVAEAVVAQMVARLLQAREAIALGFITVDAKLAARLKKNPLWMFLQTGNADAELNVAGEILVRCAAKGANKALEDDDVRKRFLDGVRQSLQRCRSNATRPELKES